MFDSKTRSLVWRLLRQQWRSWRQARVLKLEIKVTEVVITNTTMDSLTVTQNRLLNTLSFPPLPQALDARAMVRLATVPQ